MITDEFLSVTFSKKQYDKLVEREKRIDNAENNMRILFKLMNAVGLPIMSRDPHLFTKEVKSISVSRGSEIQIYLNYE